MYYKINSTNNYMEGINYQVWTQHKSETSELGSKQGTAKIKESREDERNVFPEQLLGKGF